MDFAYIDGIPAKICKEIAQICQKARLEIKHIKPVRMVNLKRRGELNP